MHRLARRLAAQLEQRMLLVEESFLQGSSPCSGLEKAHFRDESNGLDQGSGDSEHMESKQDSDLAWLSQARLLVSLAQMLPALPTQLTHSPHIRPPSTTHCLLSKPPPISTHTPQHHQPLQRSAPHGAGKMCAAPSHVATVCPDNTDDDAYKAAAARQKQLLVHAHTVRSAVQGPRVEVERVVVDGSPKCLGPCDPCDSACHVVGLQGQISQDKHPPDCKKRPHEGNVSGADQQACGLGKARGEESSIRHDCKRWRLAGENWQSCAVGCLPDESHISGRLPDLSHK